MALIMPINDNSDSIAPAFQKMTLGDRIRGVADQLRQETDIQIKATSRILSSAAQIAQNHDRLIDEVVEMVEEDLNQQSQVADCPLYSADQLKQEYRTLKAAKAHFNLKASSWDALAAKLNEEGSETTSPNISCSQASVVQRLDAIEQEIRTIQTDMQQVITLLNRITEQLV